MNFRGSKDAFDLCPQYSRMYPARYSSIALSQLDHLRQSAVYVPRFAAIPDEGNRSVGARQTFNGQVWVQPESVVWGIRAFSQQTEGFRLQCIDAGTTERWFVAPQQFQPSAADAITAQTFILPEPRIVLEPGLVNVQVQNLSASANNIQVLLMWAEPHGHDAEMQYQANLLRILRNRGALRTPDAPIIESSTSLPFRHADAIATPAPGTTAVVCQFQVPAGMNCAIKALSNQYTHTAFSEGSGDLVFRIAIDGAYQPGYDNITTTLGTASIPYRLEGTMTASSGQTVQYIVDHSAGSALPVGGTQCIATFAGWFYPQA